MGRQKISLPELGECLRQGKTVTEIAREFGMTTQGVGKKVKGLHLKISQTATLHQAGLILGQQIDANAQLLKINNSVHKTLEMLEERVQDDEGKLNHKVVAQQLQAIAEARKQIELLATVAAEWLEAKRLVNVQRIMYETIANSCCEKCRPGVIQNLGGLRSSGVLFAGDEWA